MKINLVLTKKWFDAHQNGKNTEYRAITPYWCKRFMLYHNEDVSTAKWKEVLQDADIERILDMYILSEIEFKDMDYIVYSNGMKDISILPRFERKVEDIYLGTGLTECGAEEGRYYICIDHPEGVVNKINC